MAMRFSQLPVIEYPKLLGPFIIAGIIGVGTRACYPTTWPALDFVHALSDALIVAGVVGSLIELFSARFLIQRVADDLAERLVGRGLPSEMQGQIGQILKTTLVRERFVMTFCFSDPSEDRVKITTKLTYDVKNYSDSVQEYAPNLAQNLFTIQYSFPLITAFVGDYSLVVTVTNSHR